MEILMYAWFFAIFVLLLVGLAVTVQAAERQWPALARWLDEHFGSDSMGW